MTDEEINLAIAEACGWEIPKGCVNYRINPSGKTIFFDPMSEVDPVPDYCNDLNAMHEAEKVLVLKDGGSHAGCFRYVYAGHVYQLVSNNRQPFMATARERAEAFLRTIDKWRAE